jgi:putative hemolysin
MKALSVRGSRLLSLEFSGKDPLRQKLFSLVKGGMERVLLFPELNVVYDQASRQGGGDQFFDRVLQVLNIAYNISPQDLARIPRRGPVVLVANHPFGAVEGIILAAILRSVRPDTKLMANSLLEHIPEMRDHLLLVDPFHREGSTQANIAGLRQAIRWLRAGGLLAMFPAGEVAHLDLRTRTISETEWGDSVARIIRLTRSDVIPMHFKGANGPLFQILGLVHPGLRTILLPHELLNKRDKRLEVRVGNLIPAEKLLAFSGNPEMTAYLRQRTYWLGYRKGEAQGNEAGSPTVATQPSPPTASSQPVELLRQEVDGLPPEQVLVQSDEFRVIEASANQIPHLLLEIGRLREVAFRNVGEGTGKSIDIDRFDFFYAHLFVWNAATNEVVGAYRLAPTDAILSSRGPGGLYTNTLFQFKDEFLERINPALELGRSFIRPEYQRSFNALMLLWKGIGEIVGRNPRYKTLFGAVSISNRYQPLSQGLMVEYLERHHCLPELAKSVRPRKPFRAKTTWQGEVGPIGDLEELSVVIGEIEYHQLNVPILLKQYLKLDGKLLGFNVDRNFSDVLDGLVLVDLTKTNEAILKRYMGAGAAASFLAHHRAVNAA